MNEHGLKRKVDALLLVEQRAGRLWYLKTHGGPFQRAGVPDYLLCVNGKFAALELKSPEATGADAEPTPLQGQQLRLILTAGGHVKVARSLDDVQALLTALRSHASLTG